MPSGRRAKLISILLVPILGAFSLQGSLEVVHPASEVRQPGHDHTESSAGLCDAALFQAGAHPSHYCLHLNAFAPIDSSHVAFSATIVRISPALAYDAPLVNHVSNTLNRGPPARS